MNVKTIFSATLRVVVCIASVIETVELGRSIYGKLKSKSVSMGSAPVAEAPNVETVA